MIGGQFEASVAYTGDPIPKLGLRKRCFEAKMPEAAREEAHLISHTGGRRSRGPCAKAQCRPFFTQWPRASVSWIHVPVL